MGYGLTLSRIIPLIKFHFKKKIGLIMTKLEIKEACAPKSFRYATRVPADMLVLTITLCYAVISPLILVFAIIYFGLGWLLMRNLVSSMGRACIAALDKNVTTLKKCSTLHSLA